MSSKKSKLENLYFPSGRSAKKVKEDAKIEAKDTLKSLNETLHDHAKKNLFFPKNSNLTWEQAIQFLKEEKPFSKESGTPTVKFLNSLEKKSFEGYRRCLEQTWPGIDNDMSDAFEIMMHFQEKSSSKQLKLLEGVPFEGELKLTMSEWVMEICTHFDCKYGKDHGSLIADKVVTQLFRLIINDSTIPSKPGTEGCGDWDKFFKLADSTDVPDDFMADRNGEVSPEKNSFGRTDIVK